MANRIAVKVQVKVQARTSLRNHSLQSPRPTLTRSTQKTQH